MIELFILYKIATYNSWKGNVMKNKSKFSALLLSLLCSTSVFSVERTINYQYDGLGQLTFVEDSVNGNRDYDYDDAGNRKVVSVGQLSDDAPTQPAPPIPTGLSCFMQAPNVYRASWNASTGATYYIIRSTGSVNPERTVTSTSYYIDQGGASCKWVKACNASNICSEKANF